MLRTQSTVSSSGLAVVKLVAVLASRVSTRELDESSISCCSKTYESFQKEQPVMLVPQLGPTLKFQSPHMQFRLHTHLIIKTHFS